VTTTAVSENGVLRPLALADGAVVQVTASPPPPDAPVFTPEGWDSVARGNAPGTDPNHLPA
jgi:hypothetical protein